MTLGHALTGGGAGEGGKAVADDDDDDDDSDDDEDEDEEAEPGRGGGKGNKKKKRKKEKDALEDVFWGAANAICDYGVHATAGVRAVWLLPVLLLLGLGC